MDYSGKSGNFFAAGDLDFDEKTPSATPSRPPVCPGETDGPEVRISMGRTKKTKSPEPAVSTVSGPVATPVPGSGFSAVSTSEPTFMMAGDLMDALDGKHADTKGQRWDDYSLVGRSKTLIGRDPSCDLVLDRAYVSRKHALITARGGGYFLSDQKSTSGTFLNGTRITGEAPLRERDRISMGDCNYIYSGGRLVFAKNDSETTRGVLRKTDPGRRPVVLRADIDTKQVKNLNGPGMKELIRDIHVEIREGTTVAMLGTAGAGKSTVMNCLNGMDLIGVRGRVNYRGVDLIHNFEQMKCLIGSVPQKKVFHPSFTPEEEFRQAAILRLPGDTSSREIKTRVDRTLQMLSMNGVRKNQNSKLSGGEQTRVNVGIELVADRDFLCLDEPDQGLSPNYKHELFEILQKLAHEYGKTVISIIHDVSEIDMFDQVIILAKAGGVGRLAFSGSPAAAREHFGVDIRDAYALLERNPEKYIK